MVVPSLLQAAQNRNVLGGNMVINEYQADPAAGLAGDANGDGVRSSSADEFVEMYNDSVSPIDISGWTLSDGTQVKHTFPGGTIVPGNCSIVVFGGNTPTGVFGFSLVQVASGGLSLNNNGDSITLKNGNTSIHSLIYTSAEGNANQSITLDPVGSSNYVEHSSATGANGSLYSPGVNNDGSFFSGCPIGDLPPVVSSTVPANLASGVAVGSNITLNFSEDVTIMPNAFEIDCEGSIRAWTVDGSSPTSITLNPTLDLPLGFCTVTAIATLITDLDDNIDQLDGNGDTIAGDDYSFSFIVGLPDLEIWQIQGDSTASIYDGFNISSTGNIVTALGTNGFYMQTPDARDDGDVNTSNGIFVFINTDPAPGISVGDEVDVDGQLVEFYGMTEFSFANVSVVSSSNNLPTPVLLDDNFPPNDPTVAPCSTDIIDFKYECLEGMAFNMPQGFISAGFSGGTFFPGPDADDVLVRAGTSRAFREPGVDFPGIGGFPVFDGNPEILEMDIDSLTLPLQRYVGGTEVAITGVFGFDFDEYEIWPATITILNENVVPGTVRDNSVMEATVASANLFRFFDDFDDPTTPSDDDTILSTQEYQLKLTKLSKYFREDLKSPMILGLQEVESLKVLDDLAIKIANDGGPTYSTSLFVGNDIGGIDVGFMYRSNVTATNITQLGKTDTYLFNGNPQTLHDRPPLHLQAQIAVNGLMMKLHVLVVHMRSRGGIDNADDRVKQKRLAQANSVAAMIDNIQTNFPNEAIVTLGDFNAFDFTDGYADVIGQITGLAIEGDNEYWTTPIFAANPLTQAVHTLSANEQYSFVFGGSAQLLDNAIVNDAGLLALNEIQFARGQFDVNLEYADDDTTSLRVSDHDGFVLFLSNDVIFINGFE